MREALSAAWEQGHAGPVDERVDGQGRGGGDGHSGQVVLEGAHADMTWQVRVHGDEEHLYSMLELYRAGKLIDGSGMGGPPLPAGELFTAMSGYTDHSPATALVRTHPDVIAVVATTERNVRIPVELSEVIQPWGLCFGAIILDDSDTMGGLSVYTAHGLYEPGATGP